MNPKVLSAAIRLVGMVLVAVAHAPVLSAAWSQVCGEVGALLIGAAQLRFWSDIPVGELPFGTVDTLPPKAA